MTTKIQEFRNSKFLSLCHSKLDLEPASPARWIQVLDTGPALPGEAGSRLRGNDNKNHNKIARVS
ncbi:TPA: hypothetical protein DEP94_03575 [Candidatus Nomurabacteria bacterium]|nr:hypothetical protein [Candidatus Nomurabacteria bacterium]